MTQLKEQDKIAGKELNEMKINSMCNEDTK